MRPLNFQGFFGFGPRPKKSGRGTQLCLTIGSIDIFWKNQARIIISVLIVLVGLWAFGHFGVLRNRTQISSRQPVSESNAASSKRAAPVSQPSSSTQSTEARNPDDLSVAPVTIGTSSTTIDPPLTHVEPPATHTTADGQTNVPPEVAASMLIAKAMPAYPPLAKAAGVSGTVEMQVHVSKMGTVSGLRVSSGPAMLQQPAVNAVRTWRYRPYLVNGYPVEFQTTVRVTFSLENR